MIDTKALKSKVLDLAIQGKLTEQLESDGTTEELFAQIQEEKQKQINNGIIKETETIDESSLITNIPFSVPNNWRWTKFGNTVYIVRGGSPRPIKNYITTAQDGINWIKISDVEKGGKYISNANEKIKPEGEKKSRRVYPGDFLLTNSMSFGRPYISKIEGCIHDGWLLIRNLNGYDVDYLYHLLSSQYMYSQFCKKAVGSTVDNLNIEKVCSANIPLPPIAEQKRIVKRVEEIFKLLDIIDKAQNKYSADAEILKNKLITMGIQGKLTEQLESDGTAEELFVQIQEEKQKLIKEGKIKKEKPLPPVSDEEIPFEIPKSWKWVRLGNLSKLITKGSSPKWQGVNYTDSEKGILFVTSENVGVCQMLLQRKKYIEKKFNDTHKSSIIIKGDILTNIVGASIGRTAIFDENDENANINQAVCVIRLINYSMNNFILRYMSGNDAVSLMIGKTVDTARANLSLTSVANLLVPLPPLTEQKRIADKLDEILKIIE